MKSLIRFLPKSVMCIAIGMAFTIQAKEELPDPK